MFCRFASRRLLSPARRRQLCLPREPASDMRPVGPRPLRPVSFRDRDPNVAAAILAGSPERTRHESGRWPGATNSAIDCRMKSSHGARSAPAAGGCSPTSSRKPYFFPPPAGFLAALASYRTARRSFTSGQHAGRRCLGLERRSNVGSRAMRNRFQIGSKKKAPSSPCPVGASAARSLPACRSKLRACAKLGSQPYVIDYLPFTCSSYRMARISVNSFFPPIFAGRPEPSRSAATARGHPPASS
ncbi:hypothetical protein SAMN02799624_00163 [Paenibacillus sp. UNC496MF]|nr:hypothetical protein SAMN02799624_00163 [Paenibacillus sp. UNC496MF]